MKRMATYVSQQSATHRWARYTLVMVLCLALAACSTTRRTLNIQTKATLDLQTTEHVNPDSDGRASPIVLRLFLLNDKQAFEQATFLSLYQNAEQSLGDELLKAQRLQPLVPGAARDEYLELSDKARYLGVIAEYARFDEAKSKLILPIEAHHHNRYQVRLERLALRQVEE